MARPKAADSQETRSTILDAAEDTFAERGFAGARMTVIAANAGVTHALVHYYFGDKEALYEEVVSRLFARHLSLVMERLQPPVDRARFRETVLASFDLFWEHPNQVRIMLWEMAAGDDRIERIGRPLFEAITESLPPLSTGAAANACAHHDKRDVYVTLLGALVVYFFRDPTLKQLFGENRFSEDDRQRRRAHIGAIVDLFF